MLSETILADLRPLLADCRAGHALAQGFYDNPSVFTADLALLTARWSFAGHVSELRETGDFLRADLGRESAIVLRAEDGSLRAFANVCRHRGSRLCLVPHGRTRLITCPYHAWVYDLDGSLRHAGQMGEDFARDQHSLLALPVAEIGGLIFVSFAERPPSLGPASPALAAMCARYRWGQAKIAARKSYHVDANWKLVLENYHECYHCGPAHPEFSALHALARPGSRRITGQDHESWANVADGSEPFRVMHSQLDDTARTGSRDGQPLAPPMAPEGFDGQCVFAELGFLAAFLAYRDYGVIYRFLPQAANRTAMEVIWLVDGAAVAGRDYDEAALTWLWDITSQADKRIIEHNQEGVLSAAYRPGPFSLMEPATAQYVARYLAELRGIVSAARAPAVQP